MRYRIDDVRTALKEPHYIYQEINRIYHRRLNQWEYNRDGICIHDEDWDNLIILDACRTDAYREHVVPAVSDGHFSTRESRGSATKEWIYGNFRERQLHDTVYVTGSSWILKIGDEIGSDLHAVIDAKDDFDDDQEHQIQKSLEANERFPNKRLLIHLIPPHHPFLGPTAEEYLPPVEEQGNDFFGRVRTGKIDIDQETLWRCYRENLQRVIPAVKTLLRELPGKTVVTADHGELLGDRVSPLPIREYGHVTGLYVDELVKVPWHVHKGERKDIIAEPPVQEEIDSRSEEEIEQHLQELGYKV